MANRWGNNGNSDRLYFFFWGGGSKITANGDCSHEIKRHLLLGRKPMTNVDSILKSRDITLPTKVHLVKAVVFPVVMYGCKSWTIKKAECRRIDAFQLWCWRRLLRVPWTARRSNQSILKEISPEYSLEGLMLKLKLQYFGHLIQRTDSLVPGASTGHPTHDKVMRMRPDKQGFRTRETPWTCSSLYPKTRIRQSYYFVPFTNSSDINRGLSPTTFLWRKSTLGL